MTATLTQPSDNDRNAAPYFSAEQHEQRTPIPDLIEDYNHGGAGWRGFDFTPDEAERFQALLDRTTRQTCAAIRAASVT